MRKHIFTLVLTCCMIILGIYLLRGRAYASDEPVADVVNVLLSKQEGLVQAGNPEKLYNDEEEEIALLYPLYPQGYIVVETFSNRISEFSFTCSYPYVNNVMNYYNGPLQYYVKENGRFKHVRTGQYVEEEDYHASRLCYEAKMNQHASDESPDVLPSTRASYCLGTALRLFNYNPDGRCGSVAAAILFAYYDDVIDSSMVSSYLLSDSTGQVFTDYLKPHIEDLDGLTGSSPSDVVSGMSWYIASIGLSGTYSVLQSSYTLFTTYVNCIGLGRPVVVGVASHPVYDNHWVTGYGYSQDTLLHANFAVVNDGLGHNGININWVYVDNLIYLNLPN